MRTIVIKQFGGADSLVIENLPDPEPKPGEVLIEVKAFGINHAETTCESESGPKPQRSAVSSASGW
jgi:NADPH:quinone reductase-like Zn-dependent oxidoreductase